MVTSSGSAHRSTSSTSEDRSTSEARSTSEVGSITETVVCPLDRIEVEGGVAALVDGEAVAVFRTYDGAVFALSNVDPFSGASVLARGIVGTKTVAGVSVPFVASPMHKQAFDLRTGQCLDDEAVRIASWNVLIRADGMVLVGDRRE